MHLSYLFDQEILEEILFVTTDPHGTALDHVAFLCSLRPPDRSSRLDTDTDYVRAAGELEEHLRSMVLKVALIDNYLPKLKPGILRTVFFNI